MKTIQLWAAQANTDTTEGRGPMKTIVYTEKKETALAIVNHPKFYGEYGVMGTAPSEGGKYDVKPVTINIVDSAEEFLKIDEKAERAAALAKLTPPRTCIVKRPSLIA